MSAECLILYFFAHENQPSKVGYFIKSAEIFGTVKKRPGLLRQLKTHIAFSMFPILGTHLWSMYCLCTVRLYVDWIDSQIFIAHRGDYRACTII